MVDTWLNESDKLKFEAYREKQRLHQLEIMKERETKLLNDNERNARTRIEVDSVTGRSRIVTFPRDYEFYE